MFVSSVVRAAARGLQRQIIILPRGTLVGVGVLVDRSWGGRKRFILYEDEILNFVFILISF